jgi:hypothetical protein
MDNLVQFKIKYLRLKAERYQLEADELESREMEARSTQSTKCGGKSHPAISSAKRKVKSSADKC